MPLPLLHGGGPQHTRELEGKAIFPAATLCQLINARVPLPSSQGSEASPHSLPSSCPYSHSVHSAEHKELFSPQHLKQKCLSSAPSELPRLLFVLPFKQLLMAYGTGRSWQGSSCLPWDVGPGHQLWFCQEPPSQRGHCEASPLPLI